MESSSFGPWSTGPFQTDFYFRNSEKSNDWKSVELLDSLEAGRFYGELTLPSSPTTPSPYCCAGFHANYIYTSSVYTIQQDNSIKMLQLLFKRNTFMNLFDFLIALERIFTW